jgi:FMN phosphatase YigB (HAD superfamily)
LIEAIIFDIGGVLFENIQELFLPDLARRHGLDPDQLLSLGYHHGAAWGLGQATEEDYWRGILADAGLEPGLMPELVAETATYIRPIPETWEVVHALPPGLRVGLLSNTTHEWVRRLREVAPLLVGRGQRAVSEVTVGEGFLARFDPVLLSCEAGLCKPDPAFFALLLQRLELPGPRVLFVDDREDNLTAAAAFDIQGHLFIDAAGLRADLERRGVQMLRGDRLKGE